MLKILLLGKDGQLGQTLSQTLPAHGDLRALGRDRADLENLEQLSTHINAFKPHVIINAAAYTAVDQAEKEPEKAYRINTLAVKHLAALAKQHHAWFIHYSTDYVFDGQKTSPYLETDPTHPINVYGKTKCEGEEAICAVGGQYFIFRTSWVYSPHRHNFALAILKKSMTETTLRVVDDTQGVPTSTALIAEITARVLTQMTTQPEKARQGIGIYHLTPTGNTTWFGYARLLIRLARDAGLPVTVSDDAIQPVGSDFYPTLAQRPHNSRLNTAKLSEQFDVTLPDWREDVINLVQQVAASFLPSKP